MADTRYTIIGASGSGKTCYIAGSYKAMANDDVPDFSLQALGDSTIKMLEAQLIALRDKSKGSERYPVKTRNEVDQIKTFQFNLLHNSHKVINFDLIDYAGASIVDKGSVYQKLKQSISESTVLYILVDGDIFCDDDKDERKENFYYDCAMSINPLLQEYSQEHDEGLPPIVFIVTKTDIIRKYVPVDIFDAEVSALISGFFKAAFAEGSTSYIVGVTLGKNISDDGDSGKFKPVGMHLPIVIGCYHEFYNRYAAQVLRMNNEFENLKNVKSAELEKFRADIESANRSLQIDIKTADDKKAAEAKKWKIFRNQAYLEKCSENARKSAEDIASNNRLLAEKMEKNDKLLSEKIKVNDEIISKNKELLIKMGTYLQCESDNFMTFIDGVQQKRFKTEI